MNEEKIIIKCDIKTYIKTHLFNARVANALNISIDELNNILKLNINDSTRNSIGEHYRYDEVMLLMLDLNFPSSNIITDEIIDKFLDE